VGGRGRGLGGKGGGWGSRGEMTQTLYVHMNKIKIKKKLHEKLKIKKKSTHLSGKSSCIHLFNTNTHKFLSFSFSFHCSEYSEPSSKLDYVNFVNPWCYPIWFRIFLDPYFTFLLEIKPHLAPSLLLLS
jgi:hypothetical protein